MITKREDRTPAVAETGTRVRAVDILTQRLPSVPDKPVDAGAGTAANAGVESPTNPKPRSDTNSAPGTNPAAGNALARPGSSTRSSDQTVSLYASGRRTGEDKTHHSPSRCQPSPLKRNRMRWRNNLTSVPITYTSQEQVEVYRFNPAVTIGVPLVRFPASVFALTAAFLRFL